MKNKQVEELIKITASELNLSVSDVDIIVNTFYDYIQEILKTGEYPLIKLPKLGMLYIVEKRLAKRIEKLEKITEYYYNDTNMSSYKIISENQKTLQGLYKARSIIADEKEQRIIKRKKRKEYEYNYNMERKG